MKELIANPIFIFLAFLIALVIASFSKKIYCRLRYKKRFYILPKVSVKGIASIAMVIAISISIIILITVITADVFGVVFRAWPGTRVTIEGLLIKMGGLMFGPWLGIFIGAMTDLLAVALTAGVFHYGYFIAGMAFGLMAGLISEIFKYSKNKNDIYPAIWSTVILVAIDVIVILFMFFQVNNNNVLYSFEVFGITIELAPPILIGILGGFIALGVLAVWIGLWIHKHKLKKRQKFNSDRERSNQKNWYFNFSIVIVTAIVTNALINVLMMPKFDSELSSLSYGQWLSIRAFLFIPEVIMNILVILPIFRIVVPLINYDYHEDIIEDQKVKVYVE